jgi:hypothetical protein
MNNDRPQQDDAEVVIRPSIDNQLGRPPAYYFQHPLFIAFALTLTAAGFAWTRSVLAWPVDFGLVILAAGIFVRLSFANTKLYVRGGRIGVANFLGMSKEIPLSRAKRIRLVSVVGSRRRPVTLILSPENKWLLQVGGNFFSQDDLERVAKAGGLELAGSWADSMSVAEYLSDRGGGTSQAGKVCLGSFQTAHASDRCCDRDSRRDRDHGCYP